MRRRKKSPEKADLGDCTVGVRVKRGYRITKGDCDRFHKMLRWEGKCLVFEGSRSNGYGRFHINGQTHSSHYVGIFMSDVQLPDFPYGYLPIDGQLKGIDVAHTCHNPPCVRPSHLRLASKMVNLDERDERQRALSSAVDSRELHTVQCELVPANPDVPDA